MLKKIDILFFCYWLISTSLLLFSWNTTENSLHLLLIHGLIAVLVLGIIYLDKNKSNASIAFIRSVYPLIFSGYFYSETVFYNKLFFNNIDPWLIKWEARIFGMQPSLEFSELISNKLISELLYFGYFSFYLLIIGFTLYVYFKKPKYFNKAVFFLSASLYIFYLIFCLIPSAGPMFYFSEPHNHLPDAYVFDKIMHFIQRVAEQPTGAFPSSHVSVSLIILILAWKNATYFFKWAWPFVLILILSTVYIKAHYALDVLAGIIITPFVLYLSDFLYHFPYGKSKESISM